MCSINIVLGSEMYDTGLVKTMSEATKHRGLKEYFTYYENGVVGFNHLPTTDNSFSNGYESENYHVWLNGFISNHKELAVKYNLTLETERDTEVLAKLIELDISFHELNGFFAIAFYSKKYRKISFITDRYGIKQLYSYRNKEGIRFISSEVKGILSVCPEIDLDEKAVYDWCYSLGAMTDNTVYRGIKRIEKLSMPIIKRDQKTSLISYEVAKIFLSDLWKKAIERNKYEGPDGVYLSGGIDSGIIAKSMNAKYSFSVDYLDSKYSEIDLIKKNSKGNHITYIMNDESIEKYSLETMDALDDLKAGSCYTNFAIAKLASKFVRVVYSGAGGDEFFGGYPHRLNQHINDVIRRDDSLPIQNFEISHHEYDLKFLQAVLVVEDRMSGFHTMETRYPLLDNDLVNYALSLPLEFIENKRILKDISGLSDEVIEGKKKGFSNPGFTNKEWIEFAIKNLKKYE